MDLRELIKSKRPSISENSIKTYLSILKNLYFKIFNNNNLSIENFNDDKKILEYLSDKPANKIKTILSALFVITENKNYRNKMMESIKNYNDEINKQQLTDKQKENWLDQELFKNKFDQLKSSAEYLYKKKSLNMNDLQEIQNFIILSLYYLINPRRSKDYTDLKIRGEIDKEKDNYLDNNYLVFTTYKTSKFYGTQRIEMTPELKKIITKWIKINPSDYLLFDSNKNKLSSVKLNQRLNKIFDNKKISVNAIRHTALTNKFEDTIEQNKEIKKMTSEMGSSPAMLNTYVKDITRTSKPKK